MPSWGTACWNTCWVAWTVALLRQMSSRSWVVPTFWARTNWGSAFSFWIREATFSEFSPVGGPVGIIPADRGRGEWIWDSPAPWLSRSQPQPQPFAPPGLPRDPAAQRGRTGRRGGSGRLTRAAHGAALPAGNGGSGVLRRAPGLHGDRDRCLGVPTCPRTRAPERGNGLGGGGGGGLGPGRNGVRGGTNLPPSRC